MEMPSQQLLLMDQLRSNGWQIAAVTRDLPWWADEVWTLESVWRPVGLQAFLAFKVDPMGILRIGSRAQVFGVFPAPVHGQKALQKMIRSRT